MAYHKDSKVGEMVTAASDYVVFPDYGSATIWRPILSDEIPRHTLLCARCQELHNYYYEKIAYTSVHYYKNLSLDCSGYSIELSHRG